MRAFRCLVLLSLIVPLHAVAHEVQHATTIVVDTDMGIDDAVTLAMVLQCKDVNIAALIACEGVVGRGDSAKLLAGLAQRFNREDLVVYAPAQTNRSSQTPPFRPFAMNALRQAIPSRSIAPDLKTFTPDAYISKDRKTTILALGPLTNLAAAVSTLPDIAQHIDRILIPGSTNPEQNWNLRFDREAFKTVRSSGLPLTFIDSGKGALKNERLKANEWNLALCTSPAGRFLNDLFADDQVRTHYFETLGPFHDELVFFYLIDPDIFKKTPNTVMPVNHLMTAELFKRLVESGRQGKHRVVFANRPFPEVVFQPDVAARRDAIIKKNGEAEWFAQLLMNEMHEHLGAYSVIGVKMGLYAAERLNAPQHGMRVVSHAPPTPPASCLNDGLIVSTGSSPGRALFLHEPSQKSGVEATFSYNGQTITLRLKGEYKDRIRAHIRKLLAKHSLEDEEYWNEVRLFGLNIWENWHRRDLFDIEE